MFIRLSIVHFTLSNLLYFIKVWKMKSFLSMIQGGDALGRLNADHGKLARFGRVQSVKITACRLDFQIGSIWGAGSELTEKNRDSTPGRFGKVQYAKMTDCRLDFQVGGTGTDLTEKIGILPFIRVLRVHWLVQRRGHRGLYPLSKFRSF